MKRTPLTHERVFDDKVFADNYARRHRHMVERFGREYSRKLISRGFRKGRIIDVGCGAGGSAIVLAKALPESEIYGIDLSEPLLRIAEQDAKTAALDGRIKFQMADVHRIPYDDDFFDVALSINMLHLVEDPVRMLNEIDRVLSPDGFLFMADLRRSWLGMVEKEIRSALTLQEAKGLISSSFMRAGECSSDLLWWRFEA